MAAVYNIRLWDSAAAFTRMKETADEGRVIVHETIFAPTAPPAALTARVRDLSKAIAPLLGPLPSREAYPGERLFVPESRME